jgi:radical SAM protein with 4Fe4S-binding SPASM domain
MSVALFRLGLIITYRCNSICRHCFFESSPTKKQTLNLVQGTNAIDESYELGAEWVSITGGEPFLKKDLLENLLKYSNKKGLKTEVVSNGFWAKSLEEAITILKQLKNIGLDVLNLSLDDFHQEFILISHVKNAFKAALSLGIKVVIMTTTTKNNAITIETIPEYLQDNHIQLIGAPRIPNPHAFLIESQITPAGRGENITELEYSQVPLLRCKEILTDIGIGPDGKVFPCCGPLASKIVLGDIKESNLRRILEKAWKNSTFTSLRNGIQISGEFSSKCHACLSLMDKQVLV